MSKYRNRKTIHDGITFDSKGEANRYCELKILERAGEISDLTLQPKFTLQESFKKNGKTHRAITYIADFPVFRQIDMEMGHRRLQGSGNRGIPYQTEVI